LSEDIEVTGGQGAYLGQSHGRASGIIRVVGRGFWTEDYVDAHFVELGRLVERVRAIGGDILALVDLSEAPVQSPGVVARITAQTGRIYRPADRIAIVVRSSLVKMQIKRAVALPNLEAFLSLNAALTWLTAHSRTVRAGAAA
jgi:hypothetical protein